MVKVASYKGDKSAKEAPKATWGLLAKSLRVSRTAIDAWKKLPSAPSEPDPKAWKAFVTENGLGVVGNRLGRRREVLLEDSVSKKNRLLDIEIANKERRTVDREEVNKLLLHVGSQQKAVLFAALEREMPGKVVGRTASEISAEGRKLALRLCTIFTREVETWQRQD